MRSVLVVAAGVLRLELRDRTTFFWMLVMPIAFIAIFGGVYRSGDAGKTALAVVDGDGSFLSRSLVDALRGEDLDLRLLSQAARDSAPRASRALLIPRGFSDSLASGRRVTVRLESAKGADQEEDLAAKVSAYKAIARVLANLAEVDTASAGTASAGTIPEGGASAGSGAPEHRLAVDSPLFQEQYRAQSALPGLIQVSVRSAGRGRALPTGFGASAQSMLVLFLLINTTISGAVVLTQEKQSRVLERMATMPIRTGEMLAGKVLGLLGLALLQSAIVVVAGGLLFHISWGPHPLALLALLVCLGLAAAALGIFLGGFLRTPEQAGALAWIVPLFLGAIGGTWWPLEVVPHWMQVLGHVSPAAWAMDGMHGLINFGSGAASALLPCGALLAYAVLLIPLGARALRLRE